MDDLSTYDFCEPYLMQDELVLWKGKPDKGNFINGSDIAMSLFGIMWLGFCLVFIKSVLLTPSMMMIVWFIPFIFVGFYMALGKLIQKAYLRNKTFYVITNKKIMIKSGRKIQIYNGKDLPPMEIKIHKNGNGTILFSDTIYHGRRRYHMYVMLENLVDVAKAQNAIDMMEGRNI